MGVYFNQDFSILVDDLELACFAKSATLSTDVTVLDKTSLCSQGWTEVTGGLKSGAVNIELMQDVDAGSVDDTLWPLLGTAGVPKSISVGSADGSTAYLLKSIPLNYTPVSGAVGELASATISGSSSTGPVVRGVLVHPSNVARTSSSVGTGRQIGAVAAGKKVYAALHVLASTGSSPTLDVIVQSAPASDFASPTTRLTFSQATGRTSQLLSLAGAVTDTHWRVSYTIGGTGDPSFRFGVTVGVL